MSFFSSRKFYNKVFYLFLSAVFLFESSFSPFLNFSLNIARASGSWGVSMPSDIAGAFPGAVIRGKPVDFVVMLTVVDPPSPLNFHLEAGNDLAIRGYYIERLGADGREIAMSDPARPVATQPNANAYSWDLYNLTTGTYALRFRFDVSLTTSQQNAQFYIYMQGLSNGSGIGYQDSSFPAPIMSSNSGLSAGVQIAQGTPLIVSFSGASANTQVALNSIDPTGALWMSNVFSGSTDGSGNWSKSFDTFSWQPGTYRFWTTVNGIKSSLMVFTVTASSASASASVSPPAPSPSLSLSSYNFTAGTPLSINISGAPNSSVGIFCRDPNGAVCDDPNPAATDANGKFSRTYDTTGWTPGTYHGWAAINGVKSNESQFTISISTNLTTGTHLSILSINISGAPNSSVGIFCRDPNGAVCDDPNPAATDANGKFSRTYDTTGWTPGTYHGWATINGVKSNESQFTVPASGSVATPTSGVINLLVPTPQTAPMATLTLERDQEQVQSDQNLSFSGTLNNDALASAGYSFPQGSSIFFTIPEKIAIVSLSIDGAALSQLDFIQNNQAVKIPLRSDWYSGKHSIKIVFKNAVSIVAQLDRLAAVWLTVIDSNGALLLKGRTAAAFIRHLPTEVIGAGIIPKFSIENVPNGPDYLAIPDNTVVHWTGFENIQITRGPFYRNDIPYQTTETVVSYPNDVRTYSQVAHNQNGLLKYGDISNTLISGDMVQPIPIAKFSDSLTREFITAYYQYLLGRDPSSDEVSRYLALFTNWQNPLANLWTVYQRRSDLQARFKDVSGGIDLRGLARWATTDGWNDSQDGSSLKAFKMQTGYDSAFNAFKMAAMASAIPANIIPSDNINCSYNDSISGLCWTDPMARHQLVLWAKDIGWAINFDLGCHRGEKCENDWKQQLSPAMELAYQNYGGQDWMYARLLKPFFSPGTYPEYQEERNLRYPPATLYYELLSSPEYSQSLQNRFQKNIDSLFRLYYNRPATQSDFDWAKNTLTQKRTGSWQWMSDNWEPNGLVVNCSPSTDGKTCTNPDYSSSSIGYAEDYVYGIRNIQAEVDVMSARLIEQFDNRNDADRTRVITGLYRLYLRRSPSQSEIDSLNGKGFGDIELFLNQSREYGKQPASNAAIRNMYRNYLLRDPSDSEIASWAGKSISSISQTIGNSQEIRDLASRHPENAYVFPIKRIKFSSCGFFCSILGQIIGVTLSIISYIFPPALIVSIPYSLAGGGFQLFSSTGAQIHHVFFSSISNLFNQSGFNGETFIDGISVGKSIVGMAGGVYNPTNLLENADPAIWESFRTMAQAPKRINTEQTASIFSAFSTLFGNAALASSSPSSNSSDGSYAAFHYSPVRGTATTTKLFVSKIVNFTKTLRAGSKGNDVLKLQRFLSNTDYKFIPKYQTGYYGNQTSAAIKRFQKNNGLKSTGIVDQKTRALLNAFSR